MKIKKSVTLNKKIIKKIKALAKENNMSFSEYVNIVLKNHVNDDVNK